MRKIVKKKSVNVQPNELVGYRLSSHEKVCAERMKTLFNAIDELKKEVKDLRAKRNKLLADTDYLALSDNTMSAEMTTYRQSLRDITNGLTKVAEVNAVVFPTKPA